MKKLLFVQISIFLFLCIGCTEKIYNTNISKKEQEEGVNEKEIISINGHSYLKTYQSYSKIRVITYADQNHEVSFDTYSGGLGASVEDLNKDGQKDLVVTSRAYLSNYSNTEVLIADKDGKLNLEGGKYHFKGYFPLEGKDFYYVLYLQPCEIYEVREFVQCKWTGTGFDEIQFCYFNKETKEPFCFSKKLKGCASVQDIEQERKNATIIEIDEKFEKWLLLGDY